MYTPENRSSEDYDPTGRTQAVTTQTEYAPEDFSQAAINRGQRRINYALTMVDQKIIRVLELMKEAIASTPAGREIDFDAIEEAIADAYQTNRRVADIKPPGCDTTWY